MKKDFASNIFINFIPPYVTKEEILKTFGAFGRILQEKIWKKENTNYLRANILYEKVDEA
jgi:hypothetical protein